MQPESSKDPGGTSIQKLKEACELVTITKQRSNIFLNETKRVAVNRSNFSGRKD